MSISSISSRISHILRQRRWLIMPLMGVVVVIVEAWEHIGVHESIWTVHFLMELLIYGMMIPFMGAMLLSWLDRSETMRDLAELELDRKQEFSSQLENASDWDQLVKIILQFPRSIFPVNSTHLYIKDLEHNMISFAATNGKNGVSAEDAIVGLDIGRCQSCNFWLGSPATLQKCFDSNETDSLNYCLPLAYQGAVTGILRLFLPKKEGITLEQLNMLEHFAPEMALALENARLQNLVEHQSEAVLADRQRIAQDLHDTLGQNISYLRLKLDQISCQNSLLTVAEIQKDIERMRDIANEAYRQMRGTLAYLHPNSQLELEEAIQALAEMVGERAKFKLEITNQGQPVALPPHLKRQLMYICREALNNVEKHAGAHLVKINLVWGERDLAITITDDGQGFDLNAARREDRYGLHIMTERSADLNGLLSIDSGPNQGTKVSLWLPLPALQFHHEP